MCQTCNSLTFAIILTLSPNGAARTKGRAEHMQRIVLALQLSDGSSYPTGAVIYNLTQGPHLLPKGPQLSDNPASNPANIVHSCEEELAGKFQLNKKWPTLIDAPTTGLCKKFPACLNFPPFCSQLTLVSRCTAHG